MIQTTQFGNAATRLAIGGAEDHGDVAENLLFLDHPSPMWIFEVATLRFLAVNDAAVERYGWSREEFLAMRITDIRSAADMPTLLGALAERGTHTRLPAVHRSRLGEQRDVEITSRPTFFRGRDARLVLAEDVSPRQRAERERLAMEARMSFALDAAEIGIWETDLRTHAAYWSPRCEVIHGVEPGTFGGTFDAFLECIHGDDRDGLRRDIEHAIAEHRPHEYTYRVLVGGETHWVTCRARFYYDDDGTPLRGAGIVRDVTARHQLEDSFRHAQKMEAVGRLAGGVAHDFNNLLTVISGSAELLQESLGEGHPGIEEVLQIRGASDSAAALTRQLLAFSRKQVVEPRVVSINATLRAGRKMLQRLIGEDVELEVNACDEPCDVRIDPGQLDQVIVNLAVNARDAMPSGGSLVLSTATEEVDAARAARSGAPEPGRYAVLSIADTGCGIPASIREHIFEPFFTTKDAGKGTGLGLPTVYAIVQQNGGFIDLESEPGRGTTFRIHLPLTGAAPLPAAPPRATPAAARSRETILLVEDSDTVRVVARRILQRSGYVVLDAGDPLEALAMASRPGVRIDLLLTDVVMPHMNGRVLARRFSERHPAGRVLFASGYTDDAPLLHDVRTAGVRLLQKPFTPDALIATVREVLEQ